jgi:transposase
MHLGQHDLCQMDLDYLRSLSHEALLIVSERLLQDLKEAHERLAQDSTNSSKPPSSQPAYLGLAWGGDESDSGEEADPTPPHRANDALCGEAVDEGPREAACAGEEAAEPQARAPVPGQRTTETPGRRPGKPLGAPGYGRTQVIPAHRTEVHHAESCAACGARLSADAPFMARQGFYVLDIEVGAAERPGLSLHCTLHHYGQTQCGCGHWTRSVPATGERAWDKGRSAPTALSEWRLIGPTLASLIVCLALRMRLSRARIRELLNDWLHLELSIGLIDQCIREAGLAAAPLQELLLEELRQADLLQADETPWKERGHVLWLWVFVSAQVVLFLVGRRTRQVLRQVMGERFAGWLMSDGHINYRGYPRRLRCLAHLKRKARGLAQSLDGEAREFGEAALIVLHVVFKQVRDGPDASVYGPFLELFKDLCELYRDVAHDKTRELAREFLHDWEAIWAVLDHPELPLTNNEAERALRHWVIARRISHGTRTPEGSGVVGILASVIETCRARGILPWPYLASVIARRRQGHPAPPLAAAMA